MEPEEDDNTRALMDNTAAVIENTEKISDPVKTANDLTAALSENTIELKRVKSRYNYVIVFIVCLTIVFGYAIKSRHDGEVSSCHRSNELRAQIDDKFGSIATLIQNTAPRISSGTQQLLDLLNSDFVKRDCGDIGWL